MGPWSGIYINASFARNVLIYHISIVLNDYIFSSRLINELSDQKSDELRLNRQLKEKEKEVDRLKYQLQQYVQEVHRVEDLLLKKV